jgi:hypothetical protein
MYTLFSSLFPLLLHITVTGFTQEYRGGSAGLISPVDILDFELEIANVDKRRIKQIKIHIPDDL